MTEREYVYLRVPANFVAVMPDGKIFDVNDAEDADITDAVEEMIRAGDALAHASSTCFDDMIRWDEAVDHVRGHDD